MNALTPHEAQAQLTEARMRTQGISGFTPAWASYEIIVAAMVFEVLANYCDGHPEFHALRMPLFITGFVWLAVGVGLSTFTVIVAKTALRGFGLRWGIMIGVWSVCYLALMLTTTFTPVSLTQLFIMLSIVPLLGIAGPVWEMLALRKNRKSIR
jgi:hypothetical protein